MAIRDRIESSDRLTSQIDYNTFELFKMLRKSWSNTR
jgi:hypothetical protein